MSDAFSLLALLPHEKRLELKELNVGSRLMFDAERPIDGFEGIVHELSQADEDLEISKLTDGRPISRELYEIIALAAAEEIPDTLLPTVGAGSSTRDGDVVAAVGHPPVIRAFLEIIALPRLREAGNEKVGSTGLASYLIGYLGTPNVDQTTALAAVAGVEGRGVMRPGEATVNPALAQLTIQLLLRRGFDASALFVDRIALGFGVVAGELEAEGYSVPTDTDDAPLPAQPDDTRGVSIERHTLAGDELTAFARDHERLLGELTNLLHAGAFEGAAEIQAGRERDALESAVAPVDDTPLNATLIRVIADQVRARIASVISVPKPIADAIKAVAAMDDTESDVDDAFAAANALANAIPVVTGEERQWLAGDDAWASFVDLNPEIPGDSDWLYTATWIDTNRRLIVDRILGWTTDTHAALLEATADKLGPAIEELDHHVPNTTGEVFGLLGGGVALWTTVGPGSTAVMAIIATIMQTLRRTFRPTDD